MNTKDRSLPLESLKGLFTHEQSSIILNDLSIKMLVVGNEGLQILQQFKANYKELTYDDLFDLSYLESNIKGQFFYISTDLYTRSLLGSALLDRFTVYID